MRATTLREQAADAFDAGIGLAPPLRPDAARDRPEAQAACRTTRDGRAGS